VRSQSTVRHFSPQTHGRRERRVRDAMHPLARSVDVGAPATDVVRAVVDESHPLVAVVTSTGRLVGTVSERDILQCLPPTCTPGAAALAYARFLELRAVDVMAEAGLTVCEEGCLCGVITASSVAQSICAPEAVAS